MKSQNYLNELIAKFKEEYEYLDAHIQKFHATPIKDYIKTFVKKD